MKSAKYMFWIKAALLIAIIFVCVFYLIFLFIMEFFTAYPKGENLFFYFTALIHLTVIAVCLLFLFDKISWWKQNLKG
jgi:hypothetical protein